MRNTFLSLLALFAAVILMSPTASFGTSQKSFEMTVSKTKLGNGTFSYNQGGHAMQVFGDAVYATWVDEDSLGTKIVFSSSYDGGYTWEMQETVSYLTDNNGYPGLAVGTDPSSPQTPIIHIVWSDDRDFYYSSSVNGGQWSTPYHLNGAIPADSWGASIAADSLGHVHVAWQAYVNYTSHIYYSATPDSGESWYAPVDVNPNGAYAASIGASPEGNPYIAYECNNRANICFSKGTFNGSSWSFGPGYVASGTYQPNETSIAVKDSSTIYIAWRNYTSGSTDGGITWSPNPAPITDWEPSLAVDSAGVISSAWGSSNGIDFSKSSDGGLTWDKVITVSPDGEFPNLALDSAGKALIMWNERNSVTYFSRE